MLMMMMMKMTATTTITVTMNIISKLTADQLFRKNLLKWSARRGSARNALSSSMRLISRHEFHVSFKVKDRECDRAQAGCSFCIQTLSARRRLDHWILTQRHYNGRLSVTFPVSELYRRMTGTNYMAWWHRHKRANKVPRVVRQHPGCATVNIETRGQLTCLTFYLLLMYFRHRRMCCEQRQLQRVR